jgi:hypothetical protein
MVRGALFNSMIKSEIFDNQFQLIKKLPSDHISGIKLQIRIIASD